MAVVKTDKGYKDTNSNNYFKTQGEAMNSSRANKDNPAPDAPTKFDGPANLNDALGNTSNTNTSSQSAIFDLLAKRLEEQGKGIATSASSQLQDEIAKAMADTTAAGAATKAALESERQREVGFAQDRAGAQITTAMEGRSGYATQVAGMRELTETTTKAVNDLDKRYQEAILSNDANTATSLANLRIQKLEFVQKQEEQFYSNLFSLANLEGQAADREQRGTQFERGLTHDQQMQREKYGFDFSMMDKQVRADERNMMLGLAAENGVLVGPNETIESMVAKISPFVSKKKALELQALSADINRSNAEVQRALAGARKDDERLNETDISAFASAYRMMPEGSELLLNLATSDQGKVIQAVNKLDAEELASLKETAKGYDSIEDFKADMGKAEYKYDEGLIETASRSIIERNNPGIFSKIGEFITERDNNKGNYKEDLIFGGF